MASVAGFGIELLSAAALSPETYFAPVAGRLGTSAVAKIATTRGTGSALTRGAARLSPTMKGRFAAGFAEDAALTAVITEPLYASREEMLGNPQSGMDYMTNVLLSGLVSGTLNATAGRALDKMSMTKQIESRAQQLTELATGQSSPKVDPFFRELVKSEHMITQQVGRWKMDSEFQGEVRLTHAAKTKRGKDVYRALEDAFDNQVSFKDMPASKIKVGQESFEGGTGATFKKMSGTDSYRKPPSPHAKYNLNKATHDVVIQERMRFDEEMEGIWGKTPEDVADIEIKKYEYEAPEPTTQVEQEVEKAYTTGIKSIDKASDSLRDSTYAFLAKEADSPSTKFAETDISKKEIELLNDAGIKQPHDLINLGPDGVKNAIDAVLSRRAIIAKLKKLRQSNAIANWAEWGSKGRGEVHGRLDGSLVHGAKYFEGHGDNVFRNMETYTARYANMLAADMKAQGVYHHFEKPGKEATEFWSEVERVLAGHKNVSEQAAAVGKTLADILEHQRGSLNAQGAGVQKLEGFFLRTIHDQDSLRGAHDEWKTFLMDDKNINWKRMDVANKEDFVDSAYETLMAGAGNDYKLDEALSASKTSKFGKHREILFHPGRQTHYHSRFGGSNVSKEIFTQIELRAKAQAITESMGPDYKATYRSLEASMNKSGADADDIAAVRQHWDEITGETNQPKDRNMAKLGQNFRNFVSAMVLHGTGITVALTDPVAQVINTRSLGLNKGIWDSSKTMMSSYKDLYKAWRGGDNDAIRKLKLMVRPHDTNLQGMRHALGESVNSQNGNVWERLSMFTIRAGGTAKFTEISQMTSMIGMQKTMAEAIGSELPGDLVNHLARFKITPEQFHGLSKHIVGDQLSVFDIKDTNLRNKMKQFLSEGMQMGSLQADPKQRAQLNRGWRSGTVKGELARSVTQYLPQALAQHQKLFMRMAIMGGGDARFIELLSRSKIAESATIMGMMLGSAVAVVTTKDLISNKEPFWTGDKPMDLEHMQRIMKVSGVAPLLFELQDTLRGGMAGQMVYDAFDILEAAAEGDPWAALHETKQMSPLFATNFAFAPVLLENMIGMVSDEYLRDTIARRRNVEHMSGQSELF
jgi:hypothetical protein